MKLVVETGFVIELKDGRVERRVFDGGKLREQSGHFVISHEGGETLFDKRFVKTVRKSSDARWNFPVK